MTRIPKSRYPNTHWGWHRYYVDRFNKTEHPDASFLAIQYLLLHLAHGSPVTA